MPKTGWYIGFAFLIASVLLALSYIVWEQRTLNDALSQLVNEFEQRQKSTEKKILRIEAKPNTAKAVVDNSARAILMPMLLDTIGKIRGIDEQLAKLKIKIESSQSATDKNSSNLKVKMDRTKAEVSHTARVMIMPLLDSTFNMIRRIDGRVSDQQRRLQILQEAHNKGDQLEPPPGNVGGFKDIAGRIRVPCVKKPNILKTAVIFTFGQSMADNSAKGPIKANDNVVNFDLNTGNCFQAEDPLLGATMGAGGSANFATRLGDKLVRRGVFERVILIPIAAGGTYIADWARFGPQHKRIVKALFMAKKARLKITHLLWQQGEADIWTPPQLYKDRFRSIVRSIRVRGVTAPIFVAVSTRCGLAVPKIQQAQSELPNPENFIYAGPNTDVIDIEHRYDGCHMAKSGVELQSELWFEVLAEFQSN